MRDTPVSAEVTVTVQGKEYPDILWHGTRRVDGLVEDIYTDDEDLSLDYWEIGVEEQDRIQLKLAEDYEHGAIDAVQFGRD